MSGIALVMAPGILLNGSFRIQAANSGSNVGYSNPTFGTFVSGSLNLGLGVVATGIFYHLVDARLYFVLSMTPDVPNGAEALIRVPTTGFVSRAAKYAFNSFYALTPGNPFVAGNQYDIEFYWNSNTGDT